MREILLPIYHFLDPFFFVYFGIILLSYVLFFIIGALGTYRRFSRVSVEDHSSHLHSNTLPEITFTIPTYNDEKIIVKTVENIRRLTYRHKKILIINDGSTDQTLDKLTDALKLKKTTINYRKKLNTQPIKGFYQSALYPEIICIDKKNGQKHDALNVALNACQTPYFSVIDSDTFIDPKEFESMIRPIFSDPHTIAVGAAVKIRNGHKIINGRIDRKNCDFSFLTGVQTAEYLRSFLMREGWDLLKSNYIISGAFGVFLTEPLIQVGGYGPTIANDLEIILRLNRVMKATNTPYKISYRPDPVAWTYVPDTWKDLADQRLRWQRGLFESIWFNKTVLFNPKYGFEGLFVYPYLILFEGLEPLVEIFGYIYIIVGIIFGIINPAFISIFLLVVIGFVFIQTLFALLIEDFTFRSFSSMKNLAKILFYGFIENFGYRQISLIWRVKGFFDFIKKFKQINQDAKVLNEKSKDYFDYR